MRLRAIGVVGLAMALVACSAKVTRAETGASDNSEGDVEQISREPFDEISKCGAAWHEMFEEWKLAGGARLRSIRDLRRQIADDKSSRFASMVRSVWDEQRSEGATQTSFGSWPVPQPERIRIASAFLRANSLGVPRECFSTAWASSMIWDEVILDDAGTAQQKPVEFPPHLEWESPIAGQWTLFWLLRLDSQ